MVPFGINGKLSEISEGKYTVNENVAEIKTKTGNRNLLWDCLAGGGLELLEPVFRKLYPNHH